MYSAATIDENTGLMFMPPQPIGKAELATLLGFTTGYLFGKIHENKAIMDKLAGAGYNKNQKLLTMRQMQIVCDVYGWPLNQQKKR